VSEVTRTSFSTLDPSRHPSMLHLSFAPPSLTQAELVKRMRVHRGVYCQRGLLRPSLSTVYHVCPAEVRCDSPCLVQVELSRKTAGGPRGYRPVQACFPAGRVDTPAAGYL
jgi:hypothetical protein